MAKVWREPLDPARHLDHFAPGSARPRTGHGFAYFVRVAGFTFELASIEQIQQCLAWFAQPIHPSQREQVFQPETGEWQHWHARLPAFIKRGSKRERVIKALELALREYT